MLRGAIRPAFKWRPYVLRAYFDSDGDRRERGKVGHPYGVFWLGHKGDTYHDIQSKRLEYLRNIYAQANPAITPQPNFTPREVLEKMVRSIGIDPGRVLNREALAEPHRIHATPLEREEEEIRLLTRSFTAYVIEQVKQSPDIPTPQNSSLPWWGGFGPLAVNSWGPGIYRGCHPLFSNPSRNCCAGTMLSRRAG